MKRITARPHRLLTACIDRMGEWMKQEEPCMLLVPSQYTLQAEMEVMDRLKINGSFLIDVLSPARLQSRIFERVGAPKETVFDERGKCMLLMEIIEEERDNLTVYRSTAQNGSQGLVQRMSSLIASFKRSDTTPEEVLLAAEKLSEGNPARGKLLDAGRIYAAYMQRIAGEMMMDADDVSQRMCERMGDSGVVSGQHVFVFGFDMITEGFAKELLTIAANAASLTLAVETDKNSVPDGRLFAPVNFSLDRLDGLAQKRGIPMECEQIDAPLDAPEDIRILEQGLYALGKNAVVSAPTQIELTAVSGKRQEVHQAAARMRILLAEGADSTQMAVIYPKSSGYASLLAGVLPMYGIPVYIAEKRGAGAQPLCRFVLSALAVVTGGWRLSDIVECIQSGFLGLDEEEGDALCAYCEGIDLRGEEGMRRPFTYVKNMSEAVLESLNASREKATVPLYQFHRALKEAHCADAVIGAIIQLLESVHAFDTLENMRQKLIENGLDAEAQDCSQVWQALMETLDQLHTLLGKHGASGKVVLRLLESGLSALELSALPPVDGAVVCGEIGNVRTGRVKNLFVLGLNDHAGDAGSSLLSQTEQQEAAQATGAYLGMTAQERTALAQLDELKAFTQTNERLLISYALADETGRALREGTAVQALRRLFPAMPVCGGLSEGERRWMLCAKAPAMEALSVHLSEAADRGKGLSRTFASAYASLCAVGEKESLDQMTERLKPAPERRLLEAQARTLYGRPVMSVSRLETFAQCPYKHFVRYGLSPQEELVPGVDRAELGTLYHEAAEQFTRAVMALPEFPHVPPEICDHLMDEASKPLLATWRTSPLGTSARGAALARRIGRTARRTARSIVSQYDESAFRPMQTELIFGQHQLSPILLELADGTFVYLQGRIDRVDVYEADGKTIRIIDYKSGTKKFDPTMVYWGLQLQLLIYLSAALGQIEGAQPGGFFYCRIADPTVRSDSRVQQEVEKQIAKKLALAGISLSDVHILGAQDAYHAAMINKDGTLRKNAPAVNAQAMQKMVGFACRRAAQLASQAYAGEIDDVPAERGQFTACKSCTYASVCGFDPAVKTRRRLTPKKVEDLH